MSLPKNLLFENKINVAYAKNFNSVLQPQNTSNYGLGQTAIINIPAMSNTAMSGADSLLSLKLKVRAPTIGTTSYLNRCGVASCVQRLRLFAGSQLLCDIDNYGQLQSLLTTYQSSRDDVRGKSKILQGTDEQRGLRIFNATGGADTDFEKEFAFPLMSVLSMTDNYVPLWALSSIGSLRLELQFVSNTQKFIGSNYADITNGPDGANSIFTDVKFIANMVEMSDEAMGIIQNSLHGSPVEWVCQSYSNYVYNSTLGTGTTNVSIPVASKFNSLKALYTSIRENPDGGANLFADDSPNFSLAEYSTRIGAKVIPAEKPNTIPQYLAEAERALGCVSNRHTPHSYTMEQIENATSSDLTRSSAFMVGQETESYSNTDVGGRVYQGLNTSSDDVFIQLTFGGQGGNTAVRFDTYACYDQLIVIDNGAVSVQF